MTSRFRAGRLRQARDREEEKEEFETPVRMSSVTMSLSLAFSFSGTASGVGKLFSSRSRSETPLLKKPSREDQANSDVKTKSKSPSIKKAFTLRERG